MPSCDFTHLYNKHQYDACLLILMPTARHVYARNVKGTGHKMFPFLTISAFREDKGQEVMALRSIV
jgi:hypothetical protein